MRAGQYSITPRGRIRGQPARRSLPEFQTTGRSREDDDETSTKHVSGPNRDWGLMFAGAIVQIQAIMIEKDL
jgi:hypothetical protein